MRPVWIVSPSSASRISYCGLVSCRPPWPRISSGAVEHDLLSGLEHVAEKRLVQPRRPDAAAVVADDRLEDLEAGTPRRAQAAWT